MAWTLLVYKLPPEPSAPRVAVWRALKKLPGAYLVDGTFAAPADELTALTLRHLAHDIRNAGGEAFVFEAPKAEPERALRERVRAGKG